MFRKTVAFVVLAVIAVLVLPNVPSAYAQRQYTLTVTCSSVTITDPVESQVFVQVFNGQTEIMFASGVVPLTLSFPTQPAGTVITVFINESLVFSGSCGGNDGYDPGDDRVDPKPGDRVAVYCRGDSKIEIWGIDQQGRGILLTIVTVDQLVTLTRVGTRLGSDLGTVVVKEDNPTLLSVEWYGSRYGNHAKCFVCEKISTKIRTQRQPQATPTSPTAGIPQ
jgi:hypothetical protein